MDQDIGQWTGEYIMPSIHQDTHFCFHITSGAAICASSIAEHAHALSLDLVDERANSIIWRLHCERGQYQYSKRQILDKFIFEKTLNRAIHRLVYCVLNDAAMTCVVVKKSIAVTNANQNTLS
jgi:hypothetical protein